MKLKLERRNAYFCSNCRKVTITVDIDEGVTPMFILCPYCDRQATSFMYQLPGCLAFGIQADYEWYRPSEEEMKTLFKGEMNHVANGGLLKRRRTDAKPIILK